MHSSLLFSLVALLASPVSAQLSTLPVLLEVNASDPRAVRVTATGAAPAVASDGTTAGEGIVLREVFAFDASSRLVSDITPTSSLAAGQASPYTEVRTTPGPIFVGPRDLSILVGFGPGTSDPQPFRLSDAAFAGTLVFDAEFVTFRPLGTLGEIRAGEGAIDLDAAPLIGTYRIVVPEPASLLALGGGGLLLLTRRSRPAS